MSVTQPYYSRGTVQPVQQQVPVQPPVPVQPMPIQQQPVRQPSVEEKTIERPNEKNVPKFAQILRNLGKKRNND